MYFANRIKAQNFSSESNFGADQDECEARCYGLTQERTFDPNIIIRLSALLDQNIFYDFKTSHPRLVRRSFIGKLTGECSMAGGVLLHQPYGKLIKMITKT